ncbi:S8 family serine peptidase [Thermomonas paludicola]|uniref:S8 family serine peptidase n=1 Tax=Thermomonas paludicola TaxID=2884874 RepID=UPI00211393B0|nr:S8 family serine peptidase [Thermomonas paludicola]
MFKHSSLSPLSVAVAAAIGLTACGGGGGGNVRPSNPPPVTPPPPAPKCEDQTASNYGGALPCLYRYNGTADNILVPTNADIAHSEGYTGQGVKIGMMDDGQIDSSYAPLVGKVAWYQSFVGHAGETDPSAKRGHGTVVGDVLVGTAAGSFKGGVAPGASLYWANICWNDWCGSTGWAQALSATSAQGVRLWNASIGSYSATGNQAGAHAWASASTGVLAADGLLVTVTGNDSASDAGSTAIVPLVDSRYLGHWLAVTAVALDSKGQVTGKADYANACGSAAQWCLAAPGLVYFPGVPNSAFSAGGGQGTSFAAPNVTGSAALVWQAFPWMSASNVVATLLTTATDLGDAGVDSVYGWGVVNAAKAVHGPGQFVGVFDANVAGNSTFSNTITGTGNLVKRGGGTLTLTGQNTYSGGSSVQAGTLVLTGALGSSVGVSSGATFGSKGGTIHGDYTVQAGGTTAIQVGTGLSIAGTAGLAGTLQLLPENAGYAVKPTETLLTAGKVIGTFGNVTYGSGFFWTAQLGYTSTSVTAAMTRASTAAAASASGASLAAIDGGVMADHFLASVDAAAQAGTATMQAMTMAGKLASAPTADAASASLASLTGAVHGTARSVGVRQGLNAGALLADRTRSLAQFGESGVWVQATDGAGSLRRTGYDAARYSNNGAMVGVDKAVTDGLTMGAAIGSDRTHATLDGLGGRLDTTGTTVAVYGRADVGKAGYVAGNMSHESATVKDQRSVLVGSTLEGVTGKHTDTTTQARIEAGMALDNGLAPYLAVGALRHTQGAMAEAGGAGFGLLAGKDALTMTFAELGLRFDHGIGQWVIGGDVSARRLLGGADTSFTAAFTGAPDAAFDVMGQALGKDSFRVGGHAFYRTAQGWIVYVTAGTERGTGQRSNGYATAGVKIGF